MNGMMNDPSTLWAMCIMMGIGLLLFIILLGATIYFVVRLLMFKSRVEDRPLQLLKERFVRGEITEEEFIQKRKVIGELK
jgi:putative membrane protein